MVADYLTKPLQGNKFYRFRDAIMAAAEHETSECVGIWMPNTSNSTRTDDSLTQKIHAYGEIFATK